MDDATLEALGDISMAIDDASRLRGKARIADLRRLQASIKSRDLSDVTFATGYAISDELWQRIEQDVAAQLGCSTSEF